MLVGVLACLSLTGCRDHDFDFEEHYYVTAEQMYYKVFRDQFGEIDPTHDWSTGTVVNANVDLSSLVSGDVVVRVMSSMPIHDDCVMYYKGTISEAATISFDAPKNIKHVYVTAEQNGKYVLGQYFEIKDNVCNVNASVTRAATNEVCPTTINTKKKVELKVVRGATPNRPEGNVISTECYLKDVVSSRNYESLNATSLNATSLTIKDLAKYVGTKLNAYFTEKYNNREQFDRVFSRDVIYTVAEEGPVWVDCFFGGTVFYNQFGYYYYKEGSTPEETLNNKKSADRYVLIDDARPNKVVTVNKSVNYGNRWLGMYLPEYWIDGYENKNNGVKGDEIATGTKYRLVYFDENNKASFNFPKDIKIGFFIHKIDNEDGKNSNWLTNEGLRNNEADITRIRYSDSELNKFYYPDLKYDGDPYWAAVSCRIGDKIVCGFEDNPVISESDHDMNDIMFFVEGVDPEDIPDIPIDDPKLNECMIAYEDLGTTDDFDFNDVVISVSARDENGYSTIKLRAAGGTLATKVIYKDVNGEIELKFSRDANDVSESKAGEDGTEVHEAYGVGQRVMVNTGLAWPNPRNLVPTARIKVPGEWTVGANRQRFAIKVLKSDGETYKLINIPYTSGDIPQAILIAEKNWEWPSEREPIDKRYPAFKDWVANNLAIWYSKAWGE